MPAKYSFTALDGTTVDMGRDGKEFGDALALSKSPEEREALIKRHSVRLFAQELAHARCNKSYEAYSRCADMSYSKVACYPPLEYYAACSRQSSRRLATNCALRFKRFQESYETDGPDSLVYLNDLTRCMINVPSKLPQYAKTQEGVLQKAEEYYAFRKNILGDDRKLRGGYQKLIDDVNAEKAKSS